MPGTLTRDGDRWTLRFTRNCSPSPIPSMTWVRPRDGAGWHECLDRLASDLDGTPPLPWGERWRQVHLAT